jgi:16S rRNA (guanine(527)-N(7))-methyltransferase RsmG
MDERFLKEIENDVPRGTFEMLQSFVELLTKWNKKINLISKRASIDDIWKEHILESIVLSKIISGSNGKLVDVGSGAGFPGMILAIMGHKNCTLVEMNVKKYAFLNSIAAELNLNIDILNKDIRAIDISDVQYITSRAVASASQVINMVGHIICPETKIFLQIGTKDLKREIAIMRNNRSFTLQEWQNPYKANCKIICIKNIINNAILS